ncbi:MAG: phosphoglucosamine mutase [Ruminococcaceae bacterium]|nr:phosphoglucosamine mutase [Oscillospiraceae bacterium]
MGKLFGTDGIRGIAGEELTAELAFRLGLSVAKVLTEAEHKKTRVIIGKDTRHSGDMFEAAITAGLCAMGSDVYLVGVVPTPAVAYLVRDIGADAGVMISASHNPSEYNGIKVFGSEGYKLSDELENQIEELILGHSEFVPGEAGIGRVLSGKGMIDTYERHVVSVYGQTKNPCPRRVLFDLSNGSASTTAKYIFKPEFFENFNCDFIAYDPDGVNINRNCGSTEMNALCRYVVDGGYDIGIAFDGDADRCLMCDENGKIIDGDQILAAFAMEMKVAGQLKENTAVVTKLTNLGFHQLMKREGIAVQVTDVGDRYVLEEMLRSGSVLGGEQSGHVILLDHASTGDGQITAAMGLKLLAHYPQLTASAIFGKMKRLPQVSVNVTVPNTAKKTIMSSPAVLAKKAEIEEALGENGRILLRPSGTEALIRIMLEGDQTEQLEAYANELKALIEEML